MTRLLEKAINRLSALPRPAQDRAARRIFEDILGEESATRKLVEVGVMSADLRSALLNVGVWTTEDLKPIKEAGSGWDWDVPQW